MTKLSDPILAAGLCAALGMAGDIIRMVGLVAVFWGLVGVVVSAVWQQRLSGLMLPLVVVAKGCLVWLVGQAFLGAL